MLKRWMSGMKIGLQQPSFEGLALIPPQGGGSEMLKPLSGDRLESAWEHHIETCERCILLGDTQHDVECSECGDDWHADECVKSNCDCVGPHLLRDSTIADLQNKCFEDEQACLYSQYVDRLIDDARDREDGA